MSSQIVVPKEDAEQPNRGYEDRPFPTGTFKGVIEETRVREAPDFFFRQGGEQFAAGGESGSIQLGQIEVVDASEDVGNRKFFDDNYLLSQDGTSVEDATDELNWRFGQTHRRLANLASALGAVEDRGDNVAIQDGFADALFHSGAFDGNEVVFTVKHRSYKNREGEKQVEAVIDTYSPAF